MLYNKVTIFIRHSNRDTEEYLLILLITPNAKYRVMVTNKRHILRKNNIFPAHNSAFPCIVTTEEITRNL